MTADHRCPDPEVIAAFVAGNLSGSELTMTAEHLRTCEECREIAAEAARIDREGAVPLPDAKPRSFSPWWLAAAAAALATIVFLTVHSAMRDRRTNPAIRQLVEAAPRKTRYVEARLSGGFPWAPVHSGMRGDAGTDPERMKLIGVAGTVLQETTSDTSAGARHAAALAHLLAGDAKAADQVLTSAASAGRDARMWSDLAAARYTAAVQNGDSARLAKSLAAADAALRLDPSLAEALFNRALVLEHLGLRDQARSAWLRYLTVDGTSPWAEEARQHLQALMPVTGFREEFQRHYKLLQNDPQAARELALRHPQEARVWGETEVLARWAEAMTGGDEAGAESHLRVARAFAAVLVGRGEQMLNGAIQAIDRAGPDGRRALAAAHLRFRDAQRAYRAGRPAAAEKLFAEARQAFESGDSPAALLATYFGANTMYDRGLVAEARTTLERLFSTTPQGYRAHRAQVAWQLGLARASVGQWGASLEALGESVSIFEHLQEVGYASSVRDIIAEVYDRLGERRVAWSHRIVALRSLGLADPNRLQVALAAAARGAAVNRDWPVTVSLLSLQLEVMEGSNDELLRAETLLDRARVEARLGERAAAGADLRRATEAIGRLSDPAHRDRAEADRLAVQAMLTGDPADALPLLSEAIDFHHARGRRMFLPELLLQRGRAFVATGRAEEAANDFEAGIREIESQRNAASRAEPGFGTFAVAAELFEEAISLSARRGDIPTAYAYAERQRWAPPAAAPVTPAARKDDGVPIIEYVTLPDRLLIFLAEDGGVRKFERRVTRAELAGTAEQFSAAAMSNDVQTFRAAATTLYSALVEPIAAEIESAREIVFVPDAALDGVPFGALADSRGRYLLERHAVAVAPSVAWVARAGGASPRATPRLLLMEGPQARDVEDDTLNYARSEADRVVAVYGGTADIFPRGADRDEFENRAAHADVIHFVGHAEIPDGTMDAALVTSGLGGAAGRLTAGEIAAMKFDRTRVVVLAACGTARGRQQPGDTSISVARAFVAAGVPSVAATLWPIDDALAAEFFPRLHAHLARGRPPAEALRATQLEWLHRPDAPPGMWAAVQIIGR